MIDKGIYFGEIHSYYDLGLVLSAVDIPPATPKTNYIDIPGGNGSIDLTECHGDVKYNDRECKFTFTVAKSINESEWEELKTKVNNALNGKVFKITLDKDPDYYYQGRCKINDYAVNKRLRKIVVEARVAPWKYKQSQTIITAQLTSGGQTIYLPNGKKPVCPLIVCDVPVTMNFNGVVFRFEVGSYKTPSFQLKEGTNAVSVYGVGSIQFIYQEGDL